MLQRVTVILFISLFLASHCAYSSTLALHLAYMSSAAYESEATIKSWTCNACKKYPLASVRVFTGGDIQGFTGFSASLNAVILSFRGSSNIANWILNLDFKQTAYPRCTNCKVHDGFLSGWTAIKPQVFADIQALRNTYRNAAILVTGHSLGGALAILAAADIKVTYGAIQAVYNFGQPRVGNVEFANYYQASVAPQTYRVVHYGDLVPHLPPSSFGFTHSSHQIWYDEAMAVFKECLGDSPNCANSLPATSLNTGDHSLDTYLKMKTGFLGALLDLFIADAIRFSMRLTRE